jgi:hypothetical protein
LTQRKQQYAGPALSAPDWQDRLHALEQHGRIFACSPFRRSPRSGSRAEAHLTSQTVLTLLGQSSRTQEQLIGIPEATRHG